jgi:hypothetical protein
MIEYCCAGSTVTPLEYLVNLAFVWRLGSVVPKPAGFVVSLWVNDVLESALSLSLSLSHPFKKKFLLLL